MFSKLFAPVAAVMLLIGAPSLASAVDFDVPVQKIEGAESPIDLGDVVMLNLSKIEKNPPHFVSYSVDWKVFDKGVEKKFRKNSDGSIFFGSGITPRKIIVFASVSYLYVVKDGDKFVEAGVRSVFLTTVVDIGGGNVIPPGPDPNPPGPDPTPTPDPVFPDGKYKLAAETYKLSKVVDAKSKAGAAYLAKSFETMAAKVAAGEQLNTQLIKKLLEETAEANKKALVDNKISVESWDKFFIPLEDTIYDLYVKKELKTKDDFSAAFREIASGLKAVK